MILSLQEPCLERQLMTPGSPRGTGKRTIHAKPQDAVMKDRLFSPGQGDLLRGMRFLGRYGSMGLFNLGHNRSAQLPFFWDQKLEKGAGPLWWHSGEVLYLGVLHRSHWPLTRRLYWARASHKLFNWSHYYLLTPRVLCWPGEAARTWSCQHTTQSDCVHSQSLEAEASGLGSCKQRQASRPGHLGKPRVHGPVWLQPGPSGPWQGQIYIFTGLLSSSATAGLKKSLHFNPWSHC